MKILDALFEHRNVSRAAGALGLTQSTVSHALARARDFFDDPLFVRAGKGMTVTRFGETLELDVRSLVEEGQRLISRRLTFEPAKARERVVIATTDYSQVVAISRLMAKLEREAPGIQISVRPTTPSFPKASLEKGETHLAVAGFFGDLPEGFLQSVLFTDGFETAGRRGHPALAGGTIARKEFLKSKHAVITLHGDFEDPAPMRVSGMSVREVALGTSSFTGVA